MTYLSTVGYHDGELEVEVVIADNLKSLEEAKSVGASSPLNLAVFKEDTLVIGKGEHAIVISKEATNLYQFRLCRRMDELIKAKKGVTEEDYENISWDEAAHYVKTETRKCTLPFSLESYYYGFYEKSEKTW